MHWLWQWSHSLVFLIRCVCDQCDLGTILDFVIYLFHSLNCVCFLDPHYFYVLKNFFLSVLICELVKLWIVFCLNCFFDSFMHFCVLFRVQLQLFCEIMLLNLGSLFHYQSYSLLHVFLVSLIVISFKIIFSRTKYLRLVIRLSTFITNPMLINLLTPFKLHVHSCNISYRYDIFAFVNKITDLEAN